MSVNKLDNLKVENDLQSKNMTSVDLIVNSLNN